MSIFTEQRSKLQVQDFEVSELMMHTMYVLANCVRLSPSICLTDIDFKWLFKLLNEDDMWQEMLRKN
jgi:hypothetical protein